MKMIIQSFYHDESINIASNGFCAKFSKVIIFRRQNWEAKNNPNIFLGWREHLSPTFFSTAAKNYTT